jgi:hypothetical protein
MTNHTAAIGRSDVDRLQSLTGFNQIALDAFGDRQRLNDVVFIRH